MSPVSSSGAPSMAYASAMLRRVKEHGELEGEAMLRLLETAARSAPPPGTGTLIDDVA